MINSCEKMRKIFVHSEKRRKNQTFLATMMDDGDAFHRLFMSYAQVIPNMWITCGLAVDELGMTCEYGKKTKIFHIAQK